MQETIKNYLKQFESIDKVVLFGSRARGDNKETSDYDIAIFGNLAQREKTTILYYFDEEIRSLSKFDIIFIQDIKNNELLKNIIKDGKEIYVKDK